MVTMLVGIYYNVIIAWALYYLAMSMTSVLPWSQSRCDDCRCVMYSLLSADNATITNGNATANTNTANVAEGNATASALNCCE